MKKFWTIIVALVLLVWLTGCTSPTRQAIPEDLKERAQNRQTCEDLGGEYNELKNGWNFDLSSRE